MRRYDGISWGNAIALFVAALALLALATFLASCSAPTNAIHMRVENRTERTLKFRAGSGILWKTVTLAPGETWRGWGDPRFITGELAIVVREP